MKSDRQVFDLNDSVGVAYPSSGGGQSMQGKLHIFPISRKGEPLQQGVSIEGDRALYALLEACKAALNE